jgi:site-specific recombinase XerC
VAKPDPWKPAPFDTAICADREGLGTSVGLEPSAYGTHSMRRTKAAQIYKKTGNLRAVQLLLGHTKMDSTVRYLGVDIEDALTLSEGIDL